MNEQTVWIMLGIVYVLCTVFTVIICMNERQQ